LFLTPTQVADRLLVAPVTVRLWASKGLLPSVTTPGGHRRFKRQDVEDFMARHQAQLSAKKSPARILIIDDDEQFSRYLTSLLAKHAPNAVVDVANDGFSAGIQCQTLRPDIVTLDLHMPDTNGFEVCVKLRSLFGKDKLRIVALTGFASGDNRQRILDAGADACLPKTVGAAALLTELGLMREKAA
jgi:excisionase family DNA binding protein